MEEMVLVEFLEFLRIKEFLVQKVLKIKFLLLIKEKLVIGKINIFPKKLEIKFLKPDLKEVLKVL